MREELLARCRVERIEPPTAKRVDRIVRAGLHGAEQTLIRRVVARLDEGVRDRLIKGGPAGIEMSPSVDELTPSQGSGQHIHSASGADSSVSGAGSTFLSSVMITPAAYPNLWAGVGLVRGGAGTALVGSDQEVANLRLQPLWAISSCSPRCATASDSGSPMMNRTAAAFGGGGEQLAESGDTVEQECAAVDEDVDLLAGCAE